MPRKPSPPRLWKRRERRDQDGRIIRTATWVILDRGRQFSTGSDAQDIFGAQRALADHINRRYAEAIASGRRSADKIRVADVLILYLKNVVPKHADPKKTAYSVRRLTKFFSKMFLSQVNGENCRQYAAAQGSENTARRDLEELRAAINHHQREGLHTETIKVWLPEKPKPRERWLTRSEVARLVWAAYRFREPYSGKRSKKHIARFILIGVYTGSRAGVIAQAALQSKRAWAPVLRS